MLKKAVKELDLDIRWLRKALLSRWQMSRCLKAQKEGDIKTSDDRPSWAKWRASAKMEVRQLGGWGEVLEGPGAAQCVRWGGRGQGVWMKPTKWGLTGVWRMSVFSFIPSWHDHCSLDHFTGIPLCSSHSASNSGEDYFLECPLHEAS